ncbi:3-ketosteroid 9alpha-monooxygenase subunit A [Mycobacterium sp. MAA66]|uniref:Rieske 2Fe-2S domain-containing protein n=1 Tax=Mycobacterium sp. MAA66 TaxID=3156297 RepID=UPI00351181A8
MKVPFTWKVTGWFMIGWSAEFTVGQTTALHFFGEDMAAYRDQNGELHLLEAHCKHLGAHIGHGGKVVGDCIECPFHGWRWGPDGTNRHIPYQPDRPNRALTLRSYPVKEQHGCVFMWYQPNGEPPQWDLPDIFLKFPQFDTDPNHYYRPYPEFSSRADAIPVHPQIVAENGPDSSHFRYVHGASVTPVCLHWEHVDEEWRFLTGWPGARASEATGDGARASEATGNEARASAATGSTAARSDDPDAMALRIHSHFSGLGFAMSAFEGSSNHRLIFACTPVDDEVSDMFYSIWWPRELGETSDVPPEHVRRQVEKQFLKTVWEDCDIWRHQKYVEHPPLAKVDAKPYMAMRKWATRFYEVPPAS